MTKYTIVIQKNWFSLKIMLLINALNDLYDETMNFKYKDLAKKISLEALEYFLHTRKKHFSKKS